MALRIGIVGDYDPTTRSHHATNRAIEVAADRLGLDIDSDWIPTPLGFDTALLTTYAGLWADRPLRFWITDDPHVSRA